MNHRVANCVAIAGLSLFLSGCIMHRSVVYRDGGRPSVGMECDDTTADLRVRLAAAERIMSFTQRDELLAAIAADAARVGDAETTGMAVRKITSFTARDVAVCYSAHLLLAAGQRAEALELAKLVTSFSKRDKLVSELAR